MTATANERGDGNHGATVMKANSTRLAKATSAADGDDGGNQAATSAADAYDADDDRTMVPAPPPPVVADPEAMLVMMKESTQQLDAILQKLCAANDPEHASEELYEDAVESLGVDGKSAIAELASAQNLSADAYFQAIHGFLNTGNTNEDEANGKKRIRLMEGALCMQQLSDLKDTKGFATATSDVAFMFADPLSSSIDPVEGDEIPGNGGHTCSWSSPQSLTLRAFTTQVARYVMAIDSLMTMEFADLLAQAIAAELFAHSSMDRVMETVATLFPVQAVQAGIHVDWQHGNRICKIQAQEKAWQRQWGVELVLTLDCVVRAQASTSAATSSSTSSSVLGPALSSSLRWRVFIAKDKYLLPALTTLSSIVTLELSLAQPTLIEGQQQQEHADFSHDDTTTLPEFLDVYHWGSHSTAAAATAVASTSALRLQKLEISTPFPRNRIIQAACGRAHTLLLNDAGMVFSFGHAIDGALGHGDRLERTQVVVSQPMMVEFFLEKTITIQSIACGGDDLTGFHSAAVARDGEVYTWGVGIALGLGSVQNKSIPTAVPIPDHEQSTTMTDTQATPEKIHSIACGSGFCIALSSNGSAFAWGKWSDGRLGLGRIPILTKSSRQHGNRRQLQRFQLHAKRLATIEGTNTGTHTLWHKVSCGDAHCIALTKDGRLFTWGRGGQGQLGVGDVRDAMTPVLVSPTTTTTGAQRNTMSKTWRDIAAGQDWSMAVDAHGAVWSWGAWGASVLSVATGPQTHRAATLTELLLQKHRQLHHQQQQQQQRPPKKEREMSQLPRFHWLRPQPIPSLSHGDVAIRSVSAGSRHAAAISDRGDLYVWGPASQGLLSVPTLVTSTMQGSDCQIGGSIAEQVYCGGDQIIALTSGSFLASAMQQLYGALQQVDETDMQIQSPSRTTAAMTGADLALIVGSGHVLFAHKLMLARRSAVFRELILNESRPLESTTTTTGGLNSSSATASITELLLPQLRLEVAQLVVEFLYTDNLTSSLDPLSYLIRDVLRAARQYKIRRLVRVCRQRIARVSYAPLSALLADVEGDSDSETDENDDGPKDSLNGELAFAFGDETWSDLRIVAEGRTIPVHRCMLIARSEYFRALLAFHDHQQQQLIKNKTTIQELTVEESYHGMLRVLTFIYNDELTTLHSKHNPSHHRQQRDSGEEATVRDEPEQEDEEEDEQTEQLLEDLIAADKYGLVRMKRLCEHHIVVKPANCVDVLVVADLVHAEHLKQIAMAFVQTHLDLLTASPSASSSSSPSVLQRLSHEFPHLLEELYERIQQDTQQQTLLRNWQKQIEKAVKAQQAEQDTQWQQTSAATKFPWVPLILAFVFATLYLTVMNAQESDYRIVPAVNVVVLGGVLAAAFLNKL